MEPSQVEIEVTDGPIPDEVRKRAQEDVAALVAQSLIGARERVAKNLHRLAERLQDRRHEPETVPEGEWRHGALPTPRPDHHPRPPEDREVVERVTHARGPSRAEEAAFDLDMLEDEWLLYVDATTGTDAVIRRRDGDDGYAVSVVDGPVDTAGAASVRTTVEGGPPELPVDDAIRRLDLGNEPHVFFVDTDTGRGAVVHRRYDGHYGLVRPRET